MGYKFQFITLAGWHLLNLNTFELATEYAEQGMPAYVRVQAKEFEREKDGYTATKHQREAGTAYFDQLLMTITSGESSTTALHGSTESEQFLQAVPLADVTPRANGAGSPREADDSYGSIRISK
jgi:isocitrate lyase